MMRNLHDIDKVFKDGLEDHLEPVPSSVWDALNNDLDKKQAVHFKEKYARLQRLAFLLLLLVVFTGASLFYFNSFRSKELAITRYKPKQDLRTEHIANESLSSGKRSAQADSKDSVTMNVTATDNIKPVMKALPPAIEKSSSPVTAEKQEIAKVNDVSANSNQRWSANTANVNSTGLKAQPFRQRSPAKHPVDGIEKYAAIETVLGNNTGLNNTDRKENAGVIASDRTYAAAGLLFHPATASTPSAVIPAPLLHHNVGSILLTDSINNIVKQEKAKLRKNSNGLSVHRFSLTAFVSPNHSFTRLENDGFLSGPGRDKKEALHSEQQGSSYSAGLLVNYGLSKHITLQSGLVFSAAKTTIAPKTIYARADNTGQARYELNCSTGSAYYTPKTGTPPVVGDSILITGSGTNISYIGIPVSVNYVIKAGKFLIKPGAGVSLNFLTSNRSTADFGFSTGNGKENASIDGLKSSYLDGSLGLGIEYMISKRISAGVRPIVRWAFTSINKNTPVRTYQNFTSLETGLRISL